MRTTVFFFLIASLFGVVLRSFYLLDLSFFEYKHLLHAHSHVALLGWGYMLISGAILFLFVRRSPRRILSSLYFFNLISGVGMAIFFTYQGYGAYSIAFSTLHLVSVYIFAFHALRNLHNNLNEQHIPFIRWGIYWLLISTLGLWAIAPISIVLGKLHPAYNMSIQFFLHFQFNGWFTLAVIGLLVFHAGKIHKGTTIPKIGFWLLQSSVLLTYSLSVTWIFPDTVVFYLNAVGVLLEVISFVIILRSIFTSQLFISPGNWTDNILLLGVICLVLKLIFHMVFAIPEIAMLSNSSRSYLIAFIHLVMLGSISLTGISLLTKYGLFPSNRIIKKGWILLSIAFFGTEVILFCYSVIASSVALSPNTINHLLLAITTLFPISLLMVLIGFSVSGSNKYLKQLNHNYDINQF